MSAASPSGDRPSGRSNASMAGRGAFLVLVAIAIALLILGKGLDNSPSSGTSAPATTTTTAAQETTTTSPSDTTTTAAQTSTTLSAFKTLVGNGSGVKGAAGCASKQLNAAGYQTLTPVDATTKPAATQVYYTANHKTDGQAVATVLGAKVTGAMPVHPPVASLGGASVLVVLATDLAKPSC